MKRKFADFRINDDEYALKKYWTPVIKMRNILVKHVI